MGLKDLYKGKGYLFFTVGALILFAFALLNIPNLKLGTEFVGGIVAVSNVNGTLPDGALAELKASFPEAKIHTYKTPYGTRVEVELPLPKELVELREDISRAEELSKAYIESLRQNESGGEALQELNSLAKKYGIENLSNPSLLPSKLNEVFHKKVEEYTSSLSETLKRVLGSEPSIRVVTPTLSEKFLAEIRNVVALSLIVSALFTFLIFRKPAPSVAVLTGALSDMVIALGLMSFFNIPLTLASVAALLMLFGYSLDTDIMLTTRFLKSKKPKEEVLGEALQTGLNMTTTAIISFLTLFIVSTVLRIPLYFEISSVALFGLLGDIFATWGINALLLMRFAK